MNITAKRSAVLDALSPLCYFIAKSGLSPNQATIVAFVVGIMSAIFFGTGHYILGAILYLTSGAFDLLDGFIARNVRKPTKFGAVIDWVTDKYLDIIVIGVIGIKYSTPILTLLAITGSVVNTLIKPVTYYEIDRDVPMRGVGIYGRPEIVLTIFFIFHTIVNIQLYKSKLCNYSYSNFFTYISFSENSLFD